MKFARIFAVGALAAAVSAAGITAAWAHLGPLPVSAKGAPVPVTPGLVDGPEPIVVNPARAVALGKALFWDMNVGSDGMACASCHFSAGADARTKNQRSPTSKSAKLSDGLFSLRPDNTPARPNQVLRQRDFPLVESATPLTEGGEIVRKTDDTIGSGGVFKGDFRGVDVQAQNDECGHGADTVFHVGGIGTRRVEQRNAPTVINAVFNHRQLWDGAANNVFNGQNQWGARDVDAGVWVRQADGSTKKVTLRLTNASLASQAVSVPVNADEQGCAGRTLAHLGRKLMMRRPLERQAVAFDDSVLGVLAYSKPGEPKPGLKTTYMKLIREAFAPRYWSDLNRDATKYGAPAPNRFDPKPYAYNQAEANFALFFGLALQMYEATLISDDSPFDRSARDADGIPIDLSESAQRGMQVFRDAHCNLCHIGPNFTSAAVDSNAAMVKANPEAFGAATITISTTQNVVTKLLGNGKTGFIDTGFAATGVGEDDWDAGLAGRDPFGNPLSYSEQYLDYLAGYADKVVDDDVNRLRACDMDNAIALNSTRSLARTFTTVQGIRPQPQTTDGCYNLAAAYLPTVEAARAELASANNQRMTTIVQTAYKIPNLRNVELTGPYMHNGNMATLEQVVEFYTRGGNFEGVDKQGALVFPQPELEFDEEKRADLIAFLKSLTDERVRYARAPFDHPELFVPQGQVGDEIAVDTGNPVDPLLAQDDWLHVNAVGAGGRASPIRPFVESLAP